MLLSILFFSLRAMADVHCAFEHPLQVYTNVTISSGVVTLNGMRNYASAPYSYYSDPSVARWAFLIDGVRTGQLTEVLGGEQREKEFCLFLKKEVPEWCAPCKDSQNSAAIK